jgi:hypothetical protein
MKNRYLLWFSLLILAAVVYLERPLIDPFVLDRAARSTLFLRAKSPDGSEGSCTGVVIHRYGHNYRMLTAAHCVMDEEQSVEFGEEGPRYVTKLVPSDDEFFVEPDVHGEWQSPAHVNLVGAFQYGLDYAVLSFLYAGNLPVMEIDLTPLRVGEKVFNVSVPFGVAEMTFFGTVARTNWTVSAWKNTTIIAIPGPARGSSGSGLFDYRGRLRGLLVGQDPEHTAVIIMLPANQLFIGGSMTH